MTTTDESRRWTADRLTDWIWFAQGLRSSIIRAGEIRALLDGRPTDTASEQASELITDAVSIAVHLRTRLRKEEEQTPEGEV